MFVKGECLICGDPVTGDRLTCGKFECHEVLVQATINTFGEFKKIVRVSTGEAFKVPTRDLIELGVKEQDLDRYPAWFD